MEEDNEQQDGDSLQGENGSVARYVRLTVSLLSLNLKTLLLTFNHFSQDFHILFFIAEGTRAPIHLLHRTVLVMIQNTYQQPANRRYQNHDISHNYHFYKVICNFTY